MSTTRRHRGKFPPIFSYLFVIVGGVVTVIPFLDMVMTSFKGPGEYGKLPYKFLPAHFTWSNYDAAINQLDLARLFRNSVIVTVCVVIMVLLTSSMAGYALAKLRFRGRAVIFRFVLSTMMLPPFLLLIPDFLLLANFPLAGGNDILGRHGYGGLTTSLVSLMLPFVVSGFGIFLMRQYIQGIPDETLEAARVDGAGEFRLWFNVVLPQTKPVAVTLGLITFVNIWNEYIWTLLVSSSNSKLMTLPVGIQLLQSYLDPTRTTPIVMAGLVISTLPVLVVFLAFQKHYVRGVLASGLR